MIKAISTDLQVFEAETEDGDARFKGIAYASTIVKLLWMGRVIVNLASFTMPKSLPMLLGHNSDKPIGHADKLDIKDGKLFVEGIIYADDEEGAKVIKKANKGFPWKFSIGWDFDEEKFFPKGQKVKVNGKFFFGPLTVLGRNILKEISFTPIPADANTKAIIFSKDKSNNTQLMIDGDKQMGHDETEGTEVDYEAKLKVKDEQIGKLTDEVKALKLSIREVKLQASGIELTDEEQASMIDMPEASFDLFLSKFSHLGGGDEEAKAKAKAQAEKQAKAQAGGLFDHKAKNGKDVDGEEAKAQAGGLLAKAQKIATAHDEELARAWWV